MLTVEFFCIGIVAFKSFATEAVFKTSFVVFTEDLAWETAVKLTDCYFFTSSVFFAEIKAVELTYLLDGVLAVTLLVMFTYYGAVVFLVDGV